jgi:hypothetical protein
MHNDSGLDKAQNIFTNIDFEKIDFTDLMGGWEDTSEDYERLPSIGWPDINNELLVKMYFDGNNHYDIAVVSGGGVKERHEMENINEVNHLVIWLLVREDTLRKCEELINRKMNQGEIYTIIKKISENISAHGFVGGIEAGEMYYGGDVLIECLEYFGLDPYRKY